MRKWLLLVCIVACYCVALPIAVAQAEASPAGVSSQRAHAVLKDVLQRSEFRRYTESNVKPPNTSALERYLQKMRLALTRLLNKLADWLKRILPAPREYDTAPFRNLGVWLRYLILGVLLAAVMLVLSLLVKHWLLKREERRIGGSDRSDTPDVVRAGKFEPTAWEKALSRAEALWDAGDEREAVRLLYQACLGLLDMRGVLRYDETRANGEVLRALRRQGRDPLRQALQPIVRSFDRSWYGLLPLSSDDFSRALAQSRQFHEAVMGGRDA